MNMGEIEWGLQGKEVGRGRMGRDVGRVWRGREGELSISRGGGCQVMERKVELGVGDTRRSTTKNKNIKKKLDEGINLTKDFFLGDLWQIFLTRQFIYGRPESGFWTDTSFQSAGILWEQELGTPIFKALKAPPFSGFWGQKGHIQ